MGFDAKDICKGKMKWVWGIGCIVVVALGITIGVVSGGSKEDEMAKPVLKLMRCPKLTKESTLKLI